MLNRIVEGKNHGDTNDIVKKVAQGGNNDYTIHHEILVFNKR